MNRLRILLLVLFAASLPVMAQNQTLDQNYGSGGFALFGAIDNDAVAIGACPHPGGGVTVLMHERFGSDAILVRLLPNGQPDPSFSGDGIVRLGAFPILTTSASMMCGGLATSAPEDDRITIAARTWAMINGHVDIVVAQFDLHQGVFADGFCGGSYCVIPVAPMLFPPVNGTLPMPHADVLGLQPGPSGGLLVTGLVSNNVLERRGFVLKLSSDGQSTQVLAPTVPGATITKIGNGYVASDGDLRVFAVLKQDTGGVAWALLRMDPMLGNLSVVATGPSVATPEGEVRIGKGRIGSGGSLLVPLSYTQTGEHALFVIRGSEWRQVMLPAPVDSPWGGSTQIDRFTDQPLVATSFGNGAAGIAGGLKNSQLDHAGIYVARVLIGDGQSNPDRLDPMYGQAGRDTVAYRPEASGCTGARIPSLDVVSAANWRDGLLVLGTMQPICSPSLDYAPLTLHVLQPQVFSDGFE